MIEVVTQLSGGIGLFLIGMVLMTDSLKEMAGDTLRVWLSKFTGTPVKAILSGMGLTLLVQSSTATTLATIGFVSAGILTFSQAVGVVIGANIGTTSIGWLVALIGVKLAITSFALPLIGFGALIKLLARGKWALLGLSLAGFGLIFFGIDLLQIAMSGFAEQVNFAAFSSDSLGAQLLLVLIGLLMTIFLQSSSAAVTTTIAALATGAVDLPQALSLVIGQNIGTVATAILAAMGSTSNAKRTAAVHVVFNLFSAVLAFVILKPVFMWLVGHQVTIALLDPVIIVAAFHTAFSLFGTLFFLPFLTQFEKVIVNAIPDQTPSVLHYLDQASASVPTLAISSASKVIHQSLIDVLSLLQLAIEEGRMPSNRELQQTDEVLLGVQQYIEAMPMSDNPEDQRRLTAILRLMVYWRVLRSDLETANLAHFVRNQPMVYQVGLDFAHIIRSHLPIIGEQSDIKDVQNLHAELLNLKQWLDTEGSNIRDKVMHYAAKNGLNAAQRLELLAALRWLNRLITHTQRLTNVLMENAE